MAIAREACAELFHMKQAVRGEIQQLITYIESQVYNEFEAGKGGETERAYRQGWNDRARGLVDVLRGRL